MILCEALAAFYDLPHKLTNELQSHNQLLLSQYVGSYRFKVHRRNKLAGHCCRGECLLGLFALVQYFDELVQHSIVKMRFLYGNLLVTTDSVLFAVESHALESLRLASCNFVCIEMLLFSL